MEGRPKQSLLFKRGLDVYFVFVVIANIWVYLDHWVTGSVQLFADYSEPQMEVIWVLPPSIRPIFACIGLFWGLFRLKTTLLALSAVCGILACSNYLAAGSAIAVFVLHMVNALSTSVLISVPVILAAWVPSPGKLEATYLFSGYWKGHWILIYLFSGIPPLVGFLVILFIIPSDLPGAPIFVTPTRENKKHEQTTLAGLLYRVGKVVVDPKNYMLALAFWAVHMTFAPNPCLYGTEFDLTFTYIPRFLYFICSDLATSFETFHMYVFAPYAVATIVTIASTRASDRAGARCRYILGHAITAAISFAIMTVTSAVTVRPWILYLASFPVTAAYFSMTSLIITWAMNNETTTFNRMVVISLFAVVDEVGTQLSPNGVYPYFRNPHEWTDPLQIRVHLIDIAMMILVIVILYWVRHHLLRKNRIREVKSRHLVEDDAMFFEYII